MHGLRRRMRAEFSRGALLGLPAVETQRLARFRFADFRPGIAGHKLGVIARLPWPFRLAISSTTSVPGTVGNSRSCTGRARSGRASLPAVTSAGSWLVADNVLGSTWSDPGDNNGGIGRISRRHPPKRSSPSDFGSAGSEGDKFRQLLLNIPPCSGVGRRGCRACHIGDTKAAFGLR